VKDDPVFESEALREYISDVKSRIESELSNLCYGFSDLGLHPQIEYAVMSKGKRLRPTLVILSAEAVEGNRDNVMSLALAFELVHTATLVHDDIIDRDEVRRGIPALHRRWSVDDAILAGDALIALSISLASGYGEAVLKIVAESALHLCDGEHADTLYTNKLVDEKTYLKVIKDKSASLFKAAAYCGALVGGGSQSEVLSLADYGENLGIAYQLRDDLIDLASAFGSISRLKKTPLTLPLIRLYETSQPSEKVKIEKDLEFLAEGNLHDCTTGKMLKMLKESGAISYSRALFAEYIRRSIESLSCVRESDHKSFLIQIAKSLETAI